MKKIILIAGLAIFALLSLSQPAEAGPGILYPDPVDPCLGPDDPFCTGGGGGGGGGLPSCRCCATRSSGLGTIAASCCSAGSGCAVLQLTGYAISHNGGATCNVYCPGGQCYCSMSGACNSLTSVPDQQWLSG